MESPAAFVCVRCGAPLALPRDPSIVDVVCSFCDTTTPVPAAHMEALRRSKLGGDAPTPVSSAGPVLFVAVGVAVLLGLVGIVVAVRSSSAPAPAPAPTPLAVVPLPPAPTIEPVTVAPAPPGIATLVTTFGGKGTGAGLYSDARAIAVDPDGDVFVGEYASGRLHKYDASGRFAETIAVPPRNGDSYLFGLAADWSGTLYVSRSYEIVKLSTKTGAVTGTIHERPRADRQRATPNEMCPKAIALDAANHVYVMSDCTPEGISVNIESPYSLSKLDSKGKLLAHWRDAGASEGPFAVDGDGTIYVAHSSSSISISIYDANGKYVNKWGQSGKDPGDFPGGLDALAVDGHGHVLVVSYGGVQVFDVSGKYRGRFGKDGGRSIAVGAKGDVYLLANGGPVEKYQLAIPE